MNVFRDKRLLIAIIILVAAVFAVVRIAKSIHQSTNASQNKSARQSGQSANKAGQVSTGSGSGMPGCTCHSKKPGMVKMHDALGGENCGDCHEESENLMDPNRPPTSPAGMDKRIKTEAACTKCHLADGTILSTNPQKGKVKITGAFFCAKCRKQVNINEKTCDSCGGTISKDQSGFKCSTCGPLINIDKVAKMSKEKPSNDICTLCHFDDRELTLKHGNIEAYNKSKDSISGGLANCLGCHKSHNQCGGCHF